MSISAESILAQIADLDLTSEEKDLISNAYVEIDTDNNGFIDEDEIGNLLASVNQVTPAYKVRMLLEQADTNGDNKISPQEFVKMYKKLTADKLAKTFKAAVTAKAGIKGTGATSKASAEGTTHSYSDEEVVAYSNWIIKGLKDDPDCKHMLDGLKGEGLFNGLVDGVVLCKLINTSVPDTIDERVINLGKNLSVFKVQENQNLALNSASSIGCSIVNIGAQDIIEGKPHLILGLLWQVIRIGLFAKISLERSPDLAALLDEDSDETLEDLMNLSPDELLLRWMNYHLARSDKWKSLRGEGATVSNFSGDIKDSVAYCCLLEQIQPVDEESEDYAIQPPINSSAATMNLGNEARAAMMLDDAERMNCREFVTASDVAKGHQKLNLAFVANLFNTHPALKPRGDIEIIEETREVKTFRNWMNSLGVSPRVYKFARDLQDGLILAQVMSKVDKNSIDDSKLNKPPYPRIGGYMKKHENCSYCVTTGIEYFKFHLVGIAGPDIYDGDEKSTLALVWQLMREYTLKVLSDLSDDGKVVKDSVIVNWVNGKLEAGGKSSRISSFKDKSISTSHVVLDLIDSIQPGVVNFDLVSPGDTEEEKFANAKYALSVARKIGARIYAIPEDLVEVKQKMVLTVFACLMGTGLKNANNPTE